MNNIRMARDYINRAKRCLKEAENAFDEEDNPMTVRRSQECVELSLKAVLRFIGVEYPRKHDVSEVLIEVKDKLPTWFKAEKHAKHSKLLSLRRGPAMYGSEEEYKPASEIFTEKEAGEALNMAKETFQAANKLVSQHTPFSTKNINSSPPS